MNALDLLPYMVLSTADGAEVARVRGHVVPSGIPDEPLRVGFARSKNGAALIVAPHTLSLLPGDYIGHGRVSLT